MKLSLDSVSARMSYKAKFYEKNKRITCEPTKSKEINFKFRFYTLHVYFENL